MNGPAPEGEIEEEQRCAALSGLRWRVVVGAVLVHVFAGSHPHLELVYGPQHRFPAWIAAPVAGCLHIGELVAARGAWPLIAVLVGYGALERAWLRHAGTRALRAGGRVVGLVLAGAVVALNVPLMALLWGGG